MKTAEQNSSEGPPTDRAKLTGMFAAEIYTTLVKAKLSYQEMVDLGQAIYAGVPITDVPAPIKVKLFKVSDHLVAWIVARLHIEPTPAEDLGAVPVEVAKESQPKPNRAPEPEPTPEPMPEPEPEPEPEPTPEPEPKPKAKPKAKAKAKAKVKAKEESA